MITFKTIKMRNGKFKINCLRDRLAVGNIVSSKGFYLYSDLGYGGFSAAELTQITHKCCQINRGNMNAA